MQLERDPKHDTWEQDTKIQIQAKILMVVENMCDFDDSYERLIWSSIIGTYFAEVETRKCSLNSKKTKSSVSGSHSSDIDYRD